MDVFEEMYLKKDLPSAVYSSLEDYLLFEIYSPLVINVAHSRWNEFPRYVKDSVDPEMQSLIQKSNYFSDKKLKEQINAHVIVRAVNILLGYKNCKIPLTKDETIPTIQRNLLSLRGEFALKELLHASCNNEWTEPMADLALRSTHKFLMNLNYYKKIDFSQQNADNFLFEIQSKNKKETRFYFPILQLTQGCSNHCSHCCCDAKTHMSYMPYPLWRSLYESLDKYYKYYEGIQWEKIVPRKKLFFESEQKQMYAYPTSFGRFFHDSDPSQYHDSIMNVDGGDVALFVVGKGGDYYFLTKGITNALSYRAIAKACKATSIDLSFVDTPNENMDQNIRQTQETLKLIHSVRSNLGVERIFHLHLFSPSVCAEKIFNDEHIEHQKIIPAGRANQFFGRISKFLHNDVYPYVIHPNGDIVCPHCIHSHYRQSKILNLFEIANERD